MGNALSKRWAKSRRTELAHREDAEPGVGDNAPKRAENAPAGSQLSTAAESHPGSANGSTNISQASTQIPHTDTVNSKPLPAAVISPAQHAVFMAAGGRSCPYLSNLQLPDPHGLSVPNVFVSSEWHHPESVDEHADGTEASTVISGVQAEPLRGLTGAGQNVCPQQHAGVGGADRANTSSPSTLGLGPLGRTAGSSHSSATRGATAPFTAAVSLANLVNRLPTAILAVNEAGIITRANTLAEGLFGYSRGELIGQVIECLVPMEIAEEHRALRELYTGKDPAPREMGKGRVLHGRRKDGSTFPVEVGLNPLPNADGGKTIMASVVDLSARVAAEKSARIEEERTKLLVEASPSGMVLVNADGVVQMANKSAEVMFGWSRADMVGRRIEMLLPHRFRAQHVRYRSEYSKVPNARHMGVGRDLYALRRDGTEFPVEIGLQPLLMPISPQTQGEAASGKNGPAETMQQMVLCAITDITVRKQAESFATEMSEKVIQSRGEILTRMSHELRTPLNGVLGSAQLLADTPMSPEQTALLHTITSCTDVVLTVINDVLDWAKIDAGRLDVEYAPFETQDVLTDIGRVFATQAAAKDVTLTLEASTSLPRVLLGDFNRIRQVLVNMVGNALKFTPSGGKVEVRLTGEPTLADVRLGHLPHAASFALAPAEGTKSTRGAQAPSVPKAHASVRSSLTVHNDSDRTEAHDSSELVAQGAAEGVPRGLSPAAESARREAEMGAPSTGVIGVLNSLASHSHRARAPLRIGSGLGRQEDSLVDSRNSGTETPDADYFAVQLAGGHHAGVSQATARAAGYILRGVISDTGVGIPKPYQAKLFDPFEQGDVSVTRRYGGSGLGLAICKKLTKLMGGDVRLVRSERGQGTTFQFRVMTAWEPSSCTTAPPAQPRTGSMGRTVGRLGEPDSERSGSAGTVSTGAPPAGSRSSLLDDQSDRSNVDATGRTDRVPHNRDTAGMHVRKSRSLGSMGTYASHSSSHRGIELRAGGEGTTVEAPSSLGALSAGAASSRLPGQVGVSTSGSSSTSRHGRALQGQGRGGQDEVRSYKEPASMGGRADRVHASASVGRGDGDNSVGSVSREYTEATAALDRLNEDADSALSASSTLRPSHQPQPHAAGSAGPARDSSREPGMGETRLSHEPGPHPLSSVRLTVAASPQVHRSLETTVPDAMFAATGADEAAMMARALQGATVLVCDDNPVNAKLAKAFVLKLGAKAITSSDGLQCVKAWMKCTGMPSSMLAPVLARLNLSIGWTSGVSAGSTQENAGTGRGGDTSGTEGLTGVSPHAASPVCVPRAAAGQSEAHDAAGGSNSAAGPGALRVDAVLLDCEMPVMSGFDASRCIRELERVEGRGRHTAILALTASAMTGDRQRCLGAGMDAYLAKPVRFQQLKHLLARSIMKYRDENSLTAPLTPPLPGFLGAVPADRAEAASASQVTGTASSNPSSALLLTSPLADDGSSASHSVDTRSSTVTAEGVLFTQAALFSTGFLPRP